MAENRKGKDKYITLMVIPHDAGKTYSFRISSLLIGFIGLLWLATIAVSSFVLTQHIDYSVTKRANIQLSEKNAYFIKELANANQALQRVGKMEEDLRAMLKLKTKKALLEYTGEGGPTMADQISLTETLNKPALTETEFNASLGSLRQNAHSQLESYNALKKYVAYQRSLMASQPTTWPVRGWVTSRFGLRSSPFWEGVTFHQGLDIANEENISIKAPADGVVIFSGWQGTYGRLIVIDHGYGFSTRFGHLNRVLVNTNQRIKRGQVIAFLGNTGRSTAPHLHFEIRVNGVPVNPMKYLKN